MQPHPTSPNQRRPQKGGLIYYPPTPQSASGLGGQSAVGSRLQLGSIPLSALCCVRTQWGPVGSRRTKIHPDSGTPKPVFGHGVCPFCKTKDPPRRMRRCSVVFWWRQAGRQGSSTPAWHFLLPPPEAHFQKRRRSDATLESATPRGFFHPEPAHMGPRKFAQPAVGC